MAIVGMVSGCEMYRILSPFSHLRERGFETYWVENNKISAAQIHDWDVVVLPRLAPIRDQLDLFFDNARQYGQTVVFELDDDLTAIPSWNPSNITERDVADYKRAIKQSDLVTVSTPHLAKRMRELNPNVVMLPNTIDPHIWRFDHQAIRKIKGLTVGVHGGNSHSRDWEILKEIFPVIAKRYPEVTLVCAGFTPDYLKPLREELGDRFISLSWVPVQYYPLMVSQIDIGICPLIDDMFNRSKSPIKWMEHAMCGAPVVASPTVYGNHIVSGTTGFVARHEDEFLRYLTRLIEQPRLRREIGANARGYVLRHLNIHDLAPRWMSAYREAWQRTRA